MQPTSTLRPVVTFLNHGILPFVGREKETERIVMFWRETTAEPALRALLLTAEAGMGKSRLADEIILRVEQQAGAAVHLRFYPDSSLSLSPILEQALRHSAERQGLPATPSDQSSTVALLRRLSHLRPTMLILEDLHLLSGDPLRELQQLLHAIADLPISLLLLTRPIELPVRGVIEPYLADEIILQGLDERQLATLLAGLFGAMPVDWMPEVLHYATLGNPLATRSALRAAVTSGNLAQVHDGSWRVGVEREQFAAALLRGVHILTEGMVAHLSREERQLAQQLAELGEVFSLETARCLITDADRVIDSLLFRGILSPFELPISPLVGNRTDGKLLSFSHTLLHRSLTGKGALPHTQLLVALSAQLPFYSTRLIEQLDRDSESQPDLEVVHTAITRLIVAAHRLDETTDWQLSPRILDAAETLFNRYRSIWDNEFGRGIELRILQDRLAIMRRQQASPEFRDGVDRFLQSTEGGLPSQLSTYRVSALRCKYMLHYRDSNLSLLERWNELEDLIQCYPELCFTRPYILYLRDIVARAVVDRNIPMARLVEERFEQIVATGKLDDRLQLFAQRQIPLKLLSIFETEEELEGRLKFLVQIEATPHTSDGNVAIQKAMLLQTIGRVDELLLSLDRWIHQYNALGLLHNVNHLRMFGICERAAFGEDLLTIASQVRELIASAPEPIGIWLRRSAFTSLTAKAILCGAWQRGMELANEFHVPGDEVDIELRLLLAIAAGNIDEVETLVATEPRPCASSSLAGLLLDRDQTRIDVTINQARGELQTPILRTNDLLRTHLLLILISHLHNAGQEGVEEMLLPDIKHALQRAIEWLDERGLNAYMLTLLHCHRRWWTKRQAESWQARAHQIGRARKARIEASSTTRQSLHVRLLGAIEVHLPDSGVVPIRGGRLRMLLGLLVADQILSERLGHREFCQIASDDDDPERARKTMNGAVMRLRETLGPDAISTDGDTPQINLALVEVDLLNALRLCTEAYEALRARLLSRALSALREALDIWRGEVPFPTLYQSFFEAARVDFEGRVRSTVMTVAQALLSEGDPAGAEELLRRATAIMPGDEEIAELLITTLERSGRRADAERLRMAGKLE